MGLSDIMGDVGGGFLDATKTVYDKTQADWAVREARIDDAGKAAWNDAVKPTLNGFEWVYRNGVSRPVTTLMLMQDDKVEHEMGWGGAWKASRNISPGQAFTANMAARLDDAAQKFGVDDPLEWVNPNLPGGIKPFAFFGDDIENSFEELTGSGGKSEFDIFNEKQRNEVFSHDFAKFMSGASDTALRWYLDPTIIAGKAAMIGRARLLLRPLSVKGGEEAVNARLDKMFGATTDAEGVTTFTAGRLGSTSKRMADVAKRYMDLDEGMRRNLLMRDKQLGMKNPAVAEILARSADEDDFLLRLRTIMNPTGANVRALGERSKDAFDDLARYSDRTKQGLDDALREAEETLLWARNSSPISEVNAAFRSRKAAFRDLDEFRKANQRANKLDEDAWQMYQANQAQLRVPPRIMTRQRVGDLRREITGQDQYVYQPSRFSAARVIRSATSLKVGSIRHDDPGSMSRELTGLMRRAGHGVDDNIIPTRFGGNGPKGLPTAVFNELQAKVNKAATTGNAAEQAAVAREVETAVIKHNAQIIGLRVDVAEALYARFNAERQATIQTYTAKAKDPANSGAKVEMDAAGNALKPTPPDPVFSGAKMKRKLAKDIDPTAPEYKQAVEDSLSGKTPAGGDKDYVDMWYDAEDGTWTRIAVANTDLANTTPLIDIDAFTRLMRKEKMTLNAEGDGIIEALKTGDIGPLMNKAIGGDSMAYAMSEAGRTVLMNFNRVWKPAQLLRLGWPIRVVVDEQMRIMAALGAADYMEHVTQRLGNALSHGNGGATVKDMALYGRRRLAEKRLAEMDPLRAKGIHKAGLIDELEQLGHAEVENGIRLEMARRRLETAVGENAGTRVYRSAPRLAPIKPGTEAVQFRYDLPEEVMNRTHVHQYVLADLPPEKLKVLNTGHANVGVAYLDDVYDVAQLADLRDMTRTQLANHIKGEFPDAKIAKYRSKDDLLGAYGLMAARADGYAAIEQTGRSVTALSDDAIRKLDPDEARAVARVKKLQEEARDYAGLRSEITGDLEPLASWTRQMETDYHRVISKATKYREIERGTHAKPGDVGTMELPVAGRPHAFDGSIVLSHNGIHVVAEDANAGAHGRMFAELTSAGSTTRALTGTEERHLSNLRVTGGDQLNVSAYVDQSMPSAERTLRTETYNSAWEKAANGQIGQDAMLRKIAEGADEDEVLHWLRNTQHGREYVRKAPSVPRENLEEWVQRAIVHVDHYLPPGSGLAELALQGRATAKDLRAWGKSQGLTDGQLPVLHGDSLDLVTGAGKLPTLLSRIVDKAYEKIGTAPTDVLSRQPYFAAVYRREIQQRFEAMGYKDIDQVRPEEIIDMQRASRDVALKEVKRTLYDVANQSNLGHTMRFVMPFYAAWQDALQTWGRLWMEDPSRLARMAQAWEAPSKGGQVYISPDGQKYVAAPLPKFAKNALGLDENAMMPAGALKSLIFQGQYWYLPGFGAPVTVPTASIVRQRPDLATLLEPVIPYGAGGSTLDQVLPAGWKKNKSLFNEEDDEDYSKGLVRMSLEVYTDNRVKGLGMTDEQMWDEAKRRTNALFTTRMAANLALPFSPKMNSPYQLYIDSWQNMQKQQRANPTVFGTNPDGTPKSAQDHFIDVHGEDYFIFTIAATKSNIGGITPTVEGYKAFNEYKDLVREMPEMGSLIVGDTAGDYSGAVSQWMLDERIGAGDSTHLRDIRDPKTAFKDAETNRGWALFRQIDVATDSAMVEAGLTSLRSNKASGIKAMRDILIDRVKKQYPTWAEEFGTFDRSKVDRRVAFMEKLVEDPRVKQRPGFNSLIQYLDARRHVTAELKARPSHNLQSKENTDLREMFEIFTSRLRQKDTYFAELHSRWLGSDDLDTGGQV